jgi:hypothetical protein
MEDELLRADVVEEFVLNIAQRLFRKSFGHGPPIEYKGRDRYQRYGRRYFPVFGLKPKKRRRKLKQLKPKDTINRILPYDVTIQHRTARHGSISTQVWFKELEVKIAIGWAGVEVEKKQFNTMDPTSKEDITQFISETYIKIKKRKYTRNIE